MAKNFKAIIFLFFLFGPIFVCRGAAPLDMRYIPAGYAMMGAEYGDLTAQSNAKPYHLVYLDAFYMDTHEVTNEDYAVCVAAGKCKSPESVDSKTRADYYGKQTFAKFPVVNITWQDAVDYCAFVEKRLPTEAEWDRAARGTEDNRRYPWGNGTPKMNNLNTSLIPGDTEMVNIYPGGYSPYGAADMLGNVSEWVSDWYDPEWYKVSGEENPAGPETGTEKVVRGSSFETGLVDQHIVMRKGMAPDSYGYAVGFRCALSIRENIGYSGVVDTGSNFVGSRAYIKAGNENGIFLLQKPGSGYGTALLGVIPNGAVVEILAGPVSINYSDWYQIRTEEGTSGWTIASAVVMID